VAGDRGEGAGREGLDQRRSPEDVDVIAERVESQGDHVVGRIAEDTELVGGHGCGDRGVRRGDQAENRGPKQQGKSDEERAAAPGRGRHAEDDGDRGSMLPASGSMNRHLSDRGWTGVLDM